MKQVNQRTVLVLLLTLLLAGGTGIFCFLYVTQGSRWAAFSANQHAYTDGKLTAGQIYDRNGVLLFDAATGDYAEDAAIRKATLHVVGDKQGNIATSVRSALASHLVGFSPIFGTVTGGHKVTLTIDAELNKVAYEALNGKKGAVAVCNYRTGEILCMVSTPTFDPENPPTISENSTTYEGVYLNRVLSGLYAPGSVFKLVTTAAALENLSGLSDWSFTCTGSLDLGEDTITCPEAHGTEDLSAALAKSCNCAFAQLAVQLGGDTLKRYAEDAGLLSSQSISGIATAAGRFDVADAGSADLGWSGVGQYHDLVNPCGMLTLMNAIASDGTPVIPKLIKKETTMSGFPAALNLTHTGASVWSASTCEKLKEMMANDVAVTYGQSNFGDLKLCAKSGTAEVEEGKSPHAWFVGFLDDEEHPLSFVVIVENGGSGAKVAGSVANQVLQAAVQD